MVHDYIADKVINKIKEIIGIEKFDDTKILVEMEEKLPDDIILKYVVILILDKVINKIKEIIGIEKFDDTKILVEMEDKLPDDIILTNVVILITYVIKADFNFYLELFLEEALAA